LQRKLELEGWGRTMSQQSFIMHEPEIQQFQLGFMTHPCTTFQRNRTICGWVIDHSANFLGPFFRGDYFVPSNYQNWGSDKFGEELSRSSVLSTQLSD